MSTVKDKATAFKNELAGSHTNKIICKAASHELAGPKKKHVDCEFCYSAPTIVYAIVPAIKGSC